MCSEQNLTSLENAAQMLLKLESRIRGHAIRRGVRQPDEEEIFSTTCERVCEFATRHIMESSDEPLIWHIANCAIADYLNCLAKRNNVERSGVSDKEKIKTTFEKWKREEAAIIHPRSQIHEEMILALNRLRPKARDILERRHVMGQSYAEIAEAREMKIEGVRSALRYSKSQLRKMLN